VRGTGNQQAVNRQNRCEQVQATQEVTGNERRRP
jgi:hypothetical protein